MSARLPRKPWTPPTAGRPVRSPIAWAIAGATFGILPAWAVAAAATHIQPALGIGEAGLGSAIGLFMGVSAVASVPLGAVVDRVGWARGMVLIGWLGAGACLGLAFARSWTGLVLPLTVGALANAVAQPAANLALVQGIAESRHGLAFGAKQASTPASTLVAGLAMPSIAAAFDWRWAFVGLALVGLVFAALASHGRRRVGPPDTRRGRTPPVRLHRAAVAGLVTVGLGGAVGAAAANAFGSFLVAFATTTGMSPLGAGVLLAGTSALNILTRLLIGLRADRRGGRHLRVVAVMMLSGGVGFGLLSLGSGHVPLVLGACFASVGGWGWNGLFHMATVAPYHGKAASVTGMMSAFLFSGAMAGPILFGFVAERMSYSLAWSSIAAMSVFGAASILRGDIVQRRALQRTRRPPSAPDTNEDGDAPLRP